MQITPKTWSYTSPEERNHFVESVKENTYKLHVQEYGESSPFCHRMLLSIGLSLYHNLGLDSGLNFRWQYKPID